MKTPSRISPCPIIEAIAEVRFETEIDDGAIFGIIYNQIKDEFNKSLDLPVLGLPSTVRKKDPNLKFLPWYRLESNSDKNVLIQIGPRTLSVICTNTYPGWQKFSVHINFGIQKLRDAGINPVVKRVSLKYINFFEEDKNILTKTNLSILLNDRQLNSLNSNLRIEIPEGGDFINILSVGNNALRQVGENVTNGSVIEIDTVCERVRPDFFENHMGVLNECHDIEKKLFYSLLSEEYIKSLKEVIYD